MPVKALKEFLDKNKIKYLSITHSPAFTSQEIAASAHVSGKQLAKTVIVKINGQFAMVVIPAHDHVNFAVLKSVTGASNIDLATESEFKNKFEQCEVGAMPPFGNLFDMPVYVSNSLTQNSNIVFNAGSHSELLQLSFADFEKSVKPKVIPAHSV